MSSDTEPKRQPGVGRLGIPQNRQEESGDTGRISVDDAEEAHRARGPAGGQELMRDRVALCHTGCAILTARETVRPRPDGVSIQSRCSLMVEHRVSHPGMQVRILPTPLFTACRTCAGGPCGTSVAVRDRLTPRSRRCRNPRRGAIPAPRRAPAPRYSSRRFVASGAARRSAGHALAPA